MRVTFVIVSLLLASSIAGRVRACSGGGAYAAWPNAGANIAPKSSIIVAGSRAPQGVELLQDGEPAQLEDPVRLGYVPGTGDAWLVGRANAPGAEFVLRFSQNGKTEELARFSTAAEAPAGEVLPSYLRFQPVRVRYSTSEVNAGLCIFSEYESFVGGDFGRATLSASLARHEVYALQISREGGGEEHSVVIPAERAFQARPDTKPAPLDALDFDFEPGERYCATLTVYGNGDGAHEPQVSEPSCAELLELDARGPGGAGGAPFEALGEGGNAGADPKRTTAGEPFAEPAPAGPDSGAGCSFGAAPASNAGSLLLAMLLAIVAMARHRR